ncbi:hypothetical protein [Shumkonia mesophila]|uniref:hypothetical protein n=1 Tax=Shumkonia mesophila TaxID=2838854 RepID=UPI00293412B1|nr:hypothetical protein [Shumkonia mesophila]
MTITREDLNRAMAAYEAAGKIVHRGLAADGTINTGRVKRRVNEDLRKERAEEREEDEKLGIVYTKPHRRAA